MTNFETYQNLFIVFIVLFTISFFISPLFRYLFEKWKFLDLPKFLRGEKDESKFRRLHYIIYIRSGGIVIFITVLLGLMIWGRGIDHQIALYIAFGILLIGGLIDDKYDIPAKYQFLMQFLAASVVVFGGMNILDIDKGIPGIISFDFFSTNIFGLNLTFPADLIAILWLVIIMNAINWVDGLDGLSTGITAIMAATLTILAIKLGNQDAAILSTILLAATLGYLPYNFPPAKQTLVGSLGANLYGLLLGVLTIMGPTKMAGGIIILIVPVIDMVWVLVGRITSHQVINPLKLIQISDKTHLHHRLLGMGLTTRQVVFVEYFLVALVSTFSLYIFGSNRAFLVGISVLIVVGFFLAIKIYFHTRVIREVDLNESNELEFKQKFINKSTKNIHLLYKSNSLIGYYFPKESHILEVFSYSNRKHDQRKILEHIVKFARASKLTDFRIIGSLTESEVDNYMKSHGYSKEINNFKDITI